MRTSGAAALIIILAGMLAGQEPGFQQRHPRYRIEIGDVVAFTFTFTPDYNQTVTVQPDGYITLREAGDIQVLDKTTQEVVDIVRSAYGKVLHEPEITIELKDFEKPYFVVGGEVQHPGKFDLRGDTTVVQAVTLAGGLNDRALNSQILLFRRVSKDLVEVKKVDMKHMVNSGNLSEDMHLQPGDMILVPRNKMSKISRFIPFPSLGMYFSPSIP
ncbi:MAG TPA: polysaccharide biosynthesis/export family protein [Terriglobia bacterium]|jgi:polysaccharide export outer membrane protein